MKKKTNLSKRSIKNAFDTIILNCKTKHKIVKDAYLIS